MSEVKDKIEKEFESLGDNFVLLLDANAKNYFEAVMEVLALMLKGKKRGVYVTASRPYRFISKEMQKRGVDTSNMLFLDCISAMAGECSDEICTYVENPAALEEISMHMSYLLGKIDSDEKFLIIDSISTLLIYNSINSVKEFSMFLINKLRLDNVNGVLVIIEKEAPEDLKQILIAMCDKAIIV